MLIKEDIDKKKDALNEEKSLINERLQARKSAEEKASRYEQLTEYKKQLALIQMDRSRTREATELRKKIAELQGTIGWSVAEKEAKNQTDEIDQQIKAYDDYEKNGDEALERFLEDANNMKEEIKQIMSLNHDDLLNWLRTNSDDYKNSLENTRETMEFGWHDLYNQANGIIEMFNEQVEKILTNQDTYIEYMKESSEYLNATKDAQANMVTDWMNTYDQWYKTQDHTATYIHNDNNYYSSGYVNDTDDGSSYSSGGGNYSYPEDYGSNTVDLNLGGYKPKVYRSASFEGYHASGYGENEEQAKNSAKSALLSYLHTLEIQGDNNAGIYLEYLDKGTYTPQYKEESQLFSPYNDKSSGNNNSNSNSSSNNSSNNNPYSLNNNTAKAGFTRTLNLKYATNGAMAGVSFNGEGSSDEQAIENAYNKAVKWIRDNNQQLNYYVLGIGGKRYPEGYTASFGRESYSAATKNMAYEYLLKTFEASNMALTFYQDLYNGANSAKYSWYKHGGLVDYTGPAWVDGTPSDPEAFLSAPDTKMIRELIDYLHYIPTPYMTHYDPSIFSGTNSSNIESIVVNINEASVSDDVDIENLANRIGEQFNRELEKQGFTTARYRFY